MSVSVREVELSDSELAMVAGGAPVCEGNSGSPHDVVIHCPIGVLVVSCGG